MKNSAIRVVFSLLLLSVLLLSCTTTKEQAVEISQEPEPKTEEAAGPPPESFQLTIVETTDVHGALFPWDFMKDKPAKTSLAQVQTYLTGDPCELIISNAISITLNVEYNYENCYIYFEVK